jgi:hypothetical protein
MWDLWRTRWHWDRFSPSTSVSPANSHSTELHTHHHLSSGAGTIRHLVTDIPSGLSLTPPKETKKNGRYLHTEQHKHRINANIHASSGIRAHDPSVRADEASSRLRPSGHCDRQRYYTLKFGELQICARSFLAPT